MVKKMKYYYLLLLVLFVSCKFSTEQTNQEKDRDEAQKVVDSLNSYLGAQKIDQARRLFHQSLLASNDSNKFREFLVNLGNQAPFIVNRKLDHWQTNVVKGLNGGSFYAMYYLNKFKDGQELKISLILQRDDSDNIRISSYQASPDGFK